jgi:hypothetical protein
MPNPAGRHFLQIPGPGNVPHRVLRAMDMPIIDHRGPGSAELTHLPMFETGLFATPWRTTRPRATIPESNPWSPAGESINWTRMINTGARIYQ